MIKIDQNIQKLLDNGYKKTTDMGFSFTPLFGRFSSEYYYEKRIKTDEEGGAITIGSILNPEYDSMEVFVCNCIIGCCGEFQGIYPFSIETLEKILNDYIKELETL